MYQSFKQRQILISCLKFIFKVHGLKTYLIYLKIKISFMESKILVTFLNFCVKILIVKQNRMEGVSPKLFVQLLYLDGVSKLPINI